MRLLILIVLSALALNTDSTQKQSEPNMNALNLRSQRNPLAEDTGINSADVTTAELLKSPDSGNWLLYYGDYSANHYSRLEQINRRTINQLVQKWTYQVTTENINLRSSPIVYDGIIYITAANEVHALDAETGQWLWKWRAYEKRRDGNDINRGAAIYGNKIFFSTSDGQMVALDRKKGNVLWYKKYADPALGYYSRTAPLVVNDTVITGISNNNRGSKGFIVSFSASDGKELWKFWALPERSKLLGAPTWLTGSYDPRQDLIYWTVGVLAKGQNAELARYDEREIYNNGIAVLEAKSGKLRRFIKLGENGPFDWDANESLVLSNLNFKGNPKDIALQANRNGLFYVIDRSDGKVLLSKPFINRIKWTGEVICPSGWGATNWMSPSFSQVTKLVYVMTAEGCTDTATQFHIKSIQPTSGRIVWDHPVKGPFNSAPGILATGGNIVLSGDDSGNLIALEAETGRLIRNFSLGRPVFSSPVTYLVNGEQYLSIVAGSVLFTFSLHN